MSEYKLSDNEQKVYDLIKEKDGVTVKQIQEALGNKAVGAIGKLMRHEFVKKEKRRTGDSTYGLRKLETFYVLVQKEEKENEL